MIQLDYSKANLEAHNHAVDRLWEKFRDEGQCSLLDYIVFYGEGLRHDGKAGDC